MFSLFNFSSIIQTGGGSADPICLYVQTPMNIAQQRNQGCICRGGCGVEPPRKFLTPLLLLKKRKGGRLSMYLCISTVVDFNSQNFDPLMKFDKYSPERNDDGAGGDLSKLSADVE